MRIEFAIINSMSTHFEDIQREVKSLSANEKAALARFLIEELDQSVDDDAQRLWVEEAERRYEAYQRGEIEARSGDDVMRTARDRLK